jgi:DNA-binding MarR family transcriptional regulator
MGHVVDRRTAGRGRAAGIDDDVDVILAQWAAERPDLDTSPMGVVGRIARLQRVQHRAVSETLARHGLQPDEFDVLATLRRSGAPYRLTPTQLRASMMVTSATVTHRLDKLEQRGLISRRPDPADGRGLLIELTRRGRALVDRALVDHVRTEHRLLAALSPADQERLAGLLRVLGLAARAERR